MRRLSALSETRADLRIATAALLDAELEPDPSADRSAAEWSDLAALELVRSARDDHRRRAGHALAAARRSLEIAPGDLRATFNLALAAEQLYLDELARDSWLDYLAMERDAGWRREAQEHLRGLRSPTSSEEWQSLQAVVPDAAGIPEPEAFSRRFAFEVRRSFLETFLPRWAVEPVDDGPCSDLPDWRRLAAAHGAVTGDGLLSATAQWLSQRLCGSPEVEEITRAIGWVSNALEQYDRAESAASLELLQRARPTLAAADSPLVAIVDLYSAINIFALNRYAEALASFERLEPELESSGFLFLAARAAWLQGTIALRAQDLAGAAAHYERAGELFDRISDQSHRAAIRGLLAETLARMGRFGEAWDSGLEGLRIARGLGDEHRLFTSCSLMGIVAALEGAYGLAAEFQDCAAQHVRQLDNAAATTDVLLWQAAWLHRAGRHREAERSLEEARQAAAGITDGEERRQARADLALIEGALLLERSPQLARERITVATEFFDRIGHHYYAADARLLRSSASWLAGDAEQAETDLMAALRLHEKHRLDDRDPESRLAVLQTNQTIYDRLTEFQLNERHDSWRALFFADRGKQDRFEPRAELASSGRDEVHEVLERWRDALAELPENLTLASYQLLARELVTWVLRPGRQLIVERRPLPGEHREGAASRSPRGPQWRELLSGPLAGRVAKGGVLVVVPDKELNDFPFARLRADAGGPIVENAAVLVATSIDDFLTARPRRDRLDPLASVHAFLAPTPAPMWSEVPPLTPSRLEAAALRQTFPGAEIFEAREATAARFLDRLGLPGVLHFSGHVLVDDRRPLRSALLFPPDPARADGLLTAKELYGLEASGPSLVVLAGCGSGAATSSLPLGLSVVRPFLSAGAPAVLGSLRALSDADFVRFLTYFYAELERTRAVVPAFRETQRRLMQESPAGSRSWAEIQLYATGQALALRRSHV